MDAPSLLLIIGAGIFGGFLNVVAGGGSLITMPTLILLGLPSAHANGTNRIALLIQNLIATQNFKKQDLFHPHISIKLGCIAAVGGIIGAFFANTIDDSSFNTLLGVVMIFVLLITLTKPQKKLRTLEHLNTREKNLALSILFLFIGIYGGFLQAGTGFLIIAGLTLMTSYDLKNINSIKVIIIAIYLLSSISMYLYFNTIDFFIGGVLAIGMGIGGYLGSHFTINVDEKYIQLILTISVCALSLKLLGII